MALISFDGINLLLPQEAIVTIEMSPGIDNEVQVAGAIGTLKAGEGEWPVFSLDANFIPQSDCPPEYKYCVAVNQHGQAAFSLACEEVSTITIEQDSDLKPLQTCMRVTKSPIESLLYRDEKLMFVSGIDSMRSFLNLEAAA